MPLHDEHSHIAHTAEVELRQAVRTWFAGPLGRSLQAIEAEGLRALLPSLYAATALQLGHIGELDLLDGSTAPTRIVFDVCAQSRCAGVRGVPEALPFASKSVNLILLPHTLDFAADPHQVLREVDRVLMPEGHVIILGFNPLSLWGLWRLFLFRDDAVPWCGHFLRLMRVKDWLALLDLEPTFGTMLYYRPPIERARMRERLEFMERAGDRWWPLSAGVYLLVARKRELTLTPVRPRWTRRRVVSGRMSQPVARIG